MKRVLRPLGHFILDAALHHLAAVRRGDVHDVTELLREGDASCHADYRVSVAHMLYASLRPDHPGLRRMSLFGSSLRAEATPASDIDLVVHVASHDDPLVRVMQRLARELSRGFHELVPDLPPDFGLLDLHFVDDEDVETGRGFASVLTGRHEPGMRLGRQAPLLRTMRNPLASS